MRYDQLAIIYLITFSLFSACRKDPQELITLNKAFGGSGLDVASSIVKTPDGGYAIAGSTQSIDGDLSTISGNSGLSTDAWIFKINKTGQLQWTRKLGGTGADLARCIINTADGGLITAGSSETANGDVTENKGGSDAWIIKFDRNGKILWKRNFGGSGQDVANSIAQDAVGNYVFTGTSFSNDGDLSASYGDADLWVVKLNGDGDILWKRSFGGNGGDFGNSVANSPDGGYLLAGETSSLSGIPGYHGGSDVLVVKLAADGSLIWEKAYGGSRSDKSASVVPSHSGGFVISGITTSSDGDLHSSRSNFDTWLFEINNLGNIIWENAYKTPEPEGPSQVSVNPNGYSVAGSIGTAGNTRFMFLAVDPDGKLLARKTRQGKAFEAANAQTLVGGKKFIIAGSSSASAGTDAWVFTLDL